MHLYERDVNAASQFLTMNHSSTYGQRFQPHGLGRERETYQAIMHRARQILDGDAPSAMTRSEEWYWTTLREAMQRVQARLG